MSYIHWPFVDQLFNYSYNYPWLVLPAGLLIPDWYCQQVVVNGTLVLRVHIYIDHSWLNCLVIAALTGTACRVVVQISHVYWPPWINCLVIVIVAPDWYFQQGCCHWQLCALCTYILTFVDQFFHIFTNPSSTPKKLAYRIQSTIVIQLFWFFVLHKHTKI